MSEVPVRKLHHWYIAIATSAFQNWPDLEGVSDEVTSLESWLCSESLGERRFRRRRRKLADLPSKKRIENDLKKLELNDSCAAVLYITGHGYTDEDGTHWTVLNKTDAERPSWEAIETASLLGLLEGYKAVDDLMVVLDLCQAGRIEDAIPATQRARLGNRWFVIGTSSADRNSKLGAFTDSVTAVMQELPHVSGADVTDREPFLSSEKFFKLVRDKLRDTHHQELVAILDPYRVMECLPNPTYNPQDGRAVVEARRSDLAIREADLASHWDPRARGVARGEQQGWLFTGRKPLMLRLASFIDGPAGVALITGRAGSGKSAVLSRLVTFSDPEFRRQHLADVPEGETLPTEGAVDAAILATGKTTTQIAEQLATALDATPPTHEATTGGVEGWIDSILFALSPGAPPTIVIDALDEAADPEGVLQLFLRPLCKRGRGKLRLLIGVRSIPKADRHESDATLPDESGLAEVARAALDAEVIATDGEEYWDQNDLSTYITRILVDRDSPHSEQLAGTLASRIAAAVGRSFLLGAMIATRLTELEPVSPESDALPNLLKNGVAELLAEEITSSYRDPRAREQAFRILRASGLGRGRGLPWRDLWAEVAAAIGDENEQISDTDIAGVLQNRISGYLIRDLEDGITVYRPFHDELRKALLELPELFVPGGSEISAREAHRRTATLLAELIRKRGSIGASPPPYARRHLAEHAAKGNVLDVLDPITLPWLEAESVSRSLRLYEAPEHTELWDVLLAWRGVRSRWSWAKPAANAAALDAALLASSGWVPDRIPPPTGLRWRHQWAQWTWGGILIGRDFASTESLAAGRVRGIDALVASGASEMGDAQLQVWDPSTGLALGSSIIYDPAGGGGGPVCMGIVAGVPLAAVGLWSSVQVWDLATGSFVVDIPVREARGRVSIGATPDGAFLAAAARVASFIRIYDLNRGRLLPDIAVNGSVRALAFAKAGRPRLLVGIVRYPGSRVYQLDPTTGHRIGPTLRVQGGVNDIATVAAGDQQLVAVATDNLVRVYDASNGRSIGPPRIFKDEVRSVDLRASGEQLLLAAGGVDTEAVVGDVHNWLPRRLTHPGPITDVAFADVQGRAMLTTACDDGNIRLWDTGREFSATGTTITEIDSLAMARVHGRLLVAGAGKRLVTVWDAMNGDMIFEKEWSRNEFQMNREPRPLAVAIGALRGHACLLAGTGQSLLLHDLDENETIGESAFRDDPWFGMVPVPSLCFAFESVFASVVDDRYVSIMDLTRNSRVARHRRIGFLDPLLLRSSNRLLLVMRDDDGTVLADALRKAPVYRVPASQWSRVSMGRVDGRDALAWTEADRLILWDLERGETFRPDIRIDGTPGPVVLTRVADAQIALVKHSSTIRAYDVETGAIIAELPFGTRIHDVAAISEPGVEHALVGVAGPGLMVTELHGSPPASRGE